MTIVHLVALLIVFKHVEILVTINVRGVIIIVMVEEDVVARVLVVGVVDKRKKITRTDIFSIRLLGYLIPFKALQLY